MSTALLDLQHGVQALRRVVEREACLGGALGVRADHLPHQVGTVERVLTGHRIRHLLADEVGMGKTVQALMITNALRLQHEGLRVLVVVPNQLTNQWRDEQLVRGHVSFARWQEEGVYREVEELLEERRPLLVWPELMRLGVKPSIIDPERFDVLIVDEFHWLDKRYQDQIQDVAPHFEHLLLLTATPPVHDPQRLLDLLGMLEPERAQSARNAAGEDATAEEVLAALLALEAPPAPEQAVKLFGLEDGALSRVSPNGHAEALSLLRSVVRSRRKDYPTLFPQREPVSVLVEPNEAEVTRQRLMWRYLKDVDGLPVKLDVEAIAQRAIRGPRTLRERVGWLLRNDCEREGLLEAVKEWLPDAHGDTRFDALVDLLTEIWDAEPEAKVLIAAGDTRTVEELYDRLPTKLDQLCPHRAEIALAPTRIRDLRRNPDLAAGASALAGGEDANQTAVREFVSEDANLLLSAAEGQLGLNLQVTRHIVLYSLPWDPQQVEQWIGRIDRIGNSALRAEDGALQAIRIYTITQRGMADEQVVQVLDQVGVLYRSVSMQPAAVKAVHDHLTAAALSESDREWRAVVDEATELGRGGELSDVGSRWVAQLRWGPEHANKVYERVMAMKPAPCRLDTGEVERGPVGHEVALARWMKALKIAGEYHITRSNERGVWRLAYVWDETERRLGIRTSAAFGKDEFRGVKVRVPIGEQLVPEARSRVHYVLERRDLRQPPRREVQTDDGPRPLYFMDHGSPLHERLVEAWCEQGRQLPESIRVRVPDGHPAAGLRGGSVRLRVAWADAAALLPPPTFQDIHYAADMRAVRWLLPAKLLLAGVRVHLGVATAVPTELLEAALLPPLDRDRTGHIKLLRGAPPDGVVKGLHGAAGALQSQLARELRRHWTPRLDRLRESMDDRRYAVAIDGLLEQQNLATAERVVEDELAELQAPGAGHLTAALKGARTRVSKRLAAARQARQARHARVRERLDRLAAVTTAELESAIQPHVDIVIQVT